MKQQGIKKCKKGCLNHKYHCGVCNRALSYSPANYSSRPADIVNRCSVCSPLQEPALYKGVKWALSKKGSKIIQDQAQLLLYKNDLRKKIKGMKRYLKGKTMPVQTKDKLREMLNEIIDLL